MAAIYEVGINNNNLVIVKNNNKRHVSPITQNYGGLQFDDNFREQMFSSDANKDGCKINILQSIFEENTKPGDFVKETTKSLINSLITDQRIIKADILRFKKYKENMDPKIISTVDTAFAGSTQNCVSHDSGMNPKNLLKEYKKCCNSATDQIDPHSTKTGDCAIRFPEQGSSIRIDPTVFDYFAYPLPTEFRSTTIGGGYNTNFSVDTGNGVVNDLMTDMKYFSGNVEKNKFLNTSGGLDEKIKYIIAKYSGDFLQSLIQKVFELVDKESNATRKYAISTCDLVVFLRSFILNLSVMYLADDPTTEKVTQLYIWVHDMNTNVDKIFNAEKKLIVKEYDKYINLLKTIGPHTEINLPGSNSTYYFPAVFYNNMIADLERIKTIVNEFIYNKDDFTIRQLRLYKVVTAINKGVSNRYYMSGSTTNYTKGKIINPYISVAKKPSQSFFDFAFKTYGRMQGGNNKVNKLMYGGSFDEIMNDCFFVDDDDDYDDDNDDDDDDEIKDEKDEKKGEIKVKKYHSKDGMKFQIGLKIVDLHKQFIDDFTQIFNTVNNDLIYDIAKKNYGLYFANKTFDSNGFKNHLFFNCFNDVINSFAMIDIKNPRIEYYSEDGIKLLIQDFFDNEIERHKKLKNEVVLKIRIFQRDHDNITEKIGKSNRGMSDRSKLNRGKSNRGKLIRGKYNTLNRGNIVSKTQREGSQYGKNKTRRRRQTSSSTASSSNSASSSYGELDMIN